MNKLTNYFLMLLLFSATYAHAGTLNKVTMADTVKFGETNLVLNGMTIRTASNMGVTVKVYVGGLYLTSKETSAAKILASDTPKRIVQHYTFFRAPKGKIRDGWKDVYNDHCADDCASQKVHLKAFNKLAVTMYKNNKMILDFHKDKLVVSLIKKKKVKKIEILSKKFADIILKAFVNAKTDSFRKPLLGQINFT